MTSLLTNETIAAADYFVAMVFSYAACGAVVAVLKLWAEELSPEAKRVLWGFGINTLGWAIHQNWWWIWRVYLQTEYAHVSTWLQANALLLIIPYSMIIGGLIWATGPILTYFWGKHWWVRAALCVLVVWGFGLFTPLIASKVFSLL